MAQLFTGMQSAPFTLYPVLQEHVAVPGPVYLQFWEQPPLLFKQLLIALQVVPTDTKPALQEQLLTPGPA